MEAPPDAHHCSVVAAFVTWASANVSDGRPVGRGTKGTVPKRRTARDVSKSRHRSNDPVVAVERAYLAVLALLEDIAAFRFADFSIRHADENGLADATKEWLRRVRRVFARLWRAKRWVAAAIDFLNEGGPPVQLGTRSFACHHEAVVCLGEAFEPPDDVMALGRLPVGELIRSLSFRAWGAKCRSALDSTPRLGPGLHGEYLRARRAAVESDGIRVRWRDLPPRWRELIKALDSGPATRKRLADLTFGVGKGDDGTLYNDVASMVKLGILGQSKVEGYFQKAQFRRS